MKKNTLSGDDEYTEIHNINIASDKKPDLMSIYNCNNDYPSFYDINENNENIISFSILFKNQVFNNITCSKLISLKEKLTNYSFDKEIKLIEENSKYKLLKKTIHKGVFLIFSVSRNYFNGNDSQMWLYGKKNNRDITVYRLLTEEDKEWIDYLIKQKFK